MSDSEGEQFTIRFDTPLALNLVSIILWFGCVASRSLGYRYSGWNLAATFGLLVCTLITLLLSSRRVEINSELIRTSIPYRDTRSGSMRWEDVRAVGIFRPYGKNGRLFISTIPQVWYEQDLTSKKFNPNQLVAFQNNKKNLKIIRKFYSGEIVEIQ